MSSLQFAIIQCDLAWNNPEANRATIEELCADLPDVVDLVVLPETFTSGFSPGDSSAEVPGTHTYKWLLQLASRSNAAITGSIKVKEGGHLKNRLLFVTPEGGFHHYDKRHLFSIGGEGEEFTPGDRRVSVDFRGVTFRLNICYDLRFPVWARWTERDPYDVLLYVANWPSIRMNAWETLLRGRAVENQSFVIGANRVGTDDMGLSYEGGSMFVDAWGKPMAVAGRKEEILLVHFDKERQDEFRKSLPFLADGDDFQLPN